MIANWFFGVNETTYHERLHQIIADTDPEFRRWASTEIACWDNKEIPSNLMRIHGTADRMLRCSEPADTLFIQKGGHFMVMDRAGEISGYLNAMLIP